MSKRIEMDCVISKISRSCLNILSKVYMRSVVCRLTIGLDVYCYHLNFGPEDGDSISLRNVGGHPIILHCHKQEGQNKLRCFYFPQCISFCPAFKIR
jgi:hypothetical protein